MSYHKFSSPTNYSGWRLAFSPMTTGSGGDALALKSCPSHPKEGWGVLDPAAAVTPVGF